MINEERFWGVLIAVGGLLVFIFNRPLSRMTHTLHEWIGQDWLPYSWYRVMNIIGGILLAIGGLMIALGFAHLPIR